MNVPFCCLCRSAALLASITTSLSAGASSISSSRFSIRCHGPNAPSGKTEPKPVSFKHPPHPERLSAQNRGKGNRNGSLRAFSCPAVRLSRKRERDPPLLCLMLQNMFVCVHCSSLCRRESSELLQRLRPLCRSPYGQLCCEGSLAGLTQLIGSAL